MRFKRGRAAFLSVAVLILAVPLSAQVQIRLGDATHALYSELHEGLRDGTPAADSVRRIMMATDSRTLWPIARGMLTGKSSWNSGLLALTRIAELREPSSLDSVLAWRKGIQSGSLPSPPSSDLSDLLPALHAIELELDRGKSGDLPILNQLLPRIPSGQYDLADAWVFGRLGQGAADSIARRFLGTEDQALRIRYLTLLSFAQDTSLIPLLARIFVAPDSFNLPVRIGTRASDALIWIGTRRSMQALLDARAAARARGIYADPRLGHADLDFMGSDSSMVVSRTGRWLSEWVGILKDGER
jgi:hypothetical protein